MEQTDSEGSDVASRLARGEWVVRLHDQSKTGGLAVAAWRQNVVRECEEAGVPYSFHIDLPRGVTVAINPQHPPAEAELEARIAEVGRTGDGHCDEGV